MKSLITKVFPSVSSVVSEALQYSGPPDYEEQMTSSLHIASVEVAVSALQLFSSWVTWSVNKHDV